MTLQYKNNSQSGFVALMTAITLSLVLLLITITINQAGFFLRQASLGLEYKKQSSALAEACIHNALLRLAVNPAYTGNETISVGADWCAVRPIQKDTPASGEHTIEAHAAFRTSATNIRIVADSTDLSIRSWNELASF